MGVTNKLIKMIVNCRNKVKFKLTIPSSYNSIQNAFSISKKKKKKNRKKKKTKYHVCIHTYLYLYSQSYLTNIVPHNLYFLFKFITYPRDKITSTSKNKFATLFRLITIFLFVSIGYVGYIHDDRIDKICPKVPGTHVYRNSIR